MEIAKHEIGEVGLPVPATDQESAALDIIRTETVLSRLPIHNLAKRGSVNIQILKTTADGKVELKWIVSYSDRYGQARQLAYKLDTIVINHHIDEQGRPLPKMICLGSLRDVADQLDLGGDTNKVRRALRQNASAFITAKFEYRGNDGSKKTLEADFTRYSVVFTGEQLPDGRRADAVYIILNEPYREVLNNAPVRPLDRAYMKALPPAAQRFYEIISYKIFSAIKNDHPHAKITYSEYCTFSAQVRHFERQPVQDQMAKIIRHHKESGYITAVKYQPAVDAQNRPDWIMYLTPGPKAHAEFAAAHGGRRAKKRIEVDAIEAGDRQLRHRRTSPRLQQFQFEPAPPPAFDPQLVAEFTRRGITEKKTSELLANLKPGQDVVAQLELGDNLVRNARIPIVNPPGFFIRLIESNTSIPESFETSAKRKARDESERQEREQRVQEDARQLLESEYDEYCRLETDRFIAENPATFEAIKETKRAENRERYQTFSPEMIETIAQNEAKREIRKQAPLLTFEEFVNRRRPGTDFSLKPVGLPADAETVSAAPPPQEVAVTDEAADIPPDFPAVALERGEAIQPAPAAATGPAISEPAIELVLEPPREEPGGNAAEEGRV
jgi:PAS domain-containing protein